MRRLLAALSLTLVAACTTEGLVATAYPDRQTFRFKNSDASELFSYSCAPGDSEAATKARAAEAHGFLDGELSKLARRFADQIIAGAESGDATNIPALTAELEVGAERVALQTEEQYQCLFVGGREI